MFQNKQFSLIKHLDFIIADIIILEVSFFLGSYLRDRILVRSRIYISVAMVMLFIGFLTSVILNSYSGILRRGHMKELRQVITQITIVVVIETVFLYFSHYGEILSRLSFLYVAAIAIILTYAERLLLKAFVRTRTTIPRQSIILVTTSDLVLETINNLRVNNFNNFAINGVILTDVDRSGEHIEDIPVVCRASSAVDYIKANWVDGVFIHIPRGAGMVDASGKATDTWPYALANSCQEMGITVIQTLTGIRTPWSANSLNQSDRDITANMLLAGFGPYITLVRSMRFQSRGQIIAKRLLDIVGGIVGVILTALLTLIVGPLIYHASPGSIFFKQVRIGRNGKQFKLYKFRSMYPDAEERKAALMDKNKMNGLMFKIDADPRIIGSGPDGTKHGIGWFIRTTSIDEFPQFLNVLKGDMSLVGTRPPTLDEWEHYEPHHRARMAVRPGITGLWQVSGRSDIVDFEEVVRLDTEYINTWTVGGDIKILLKTIGAVVKKSGAE